MPSESGRIDCPVLRLNRDMCPQLTDDNPETLGSFDNIFQALLQIVIIAAGESCGALRRDAKESRLTCHL